MAATSTTIKDRPWVQGGLIGIAAWLLGYGLTYALVSPDVRESALQGVLEAFSGNPATYEMVGWVFYNAHFVNTVFQNVPIIGGRTTSFIGSDGFSPLLFVIPIGLLVAAGIAISRYQGVGSVNEGAIVGMTILPGYLVVSIVGVFVFEVTIGELSGSPDLLPGILLAGLIYPVVFAGAGGAIAGVTSTNT